uniref:Uncharacterized protein n=1 Tax=Anguilla anguilla TaxID=7936 RepID=A0A0E9XC20_ANGAN
MIICSSVPSVRPLSNFNPKKWLKSEESETGAYSE